MMFNAYMLDIKLFTLSLRWFQTYMWGIWLFTQTFEMILNTYNSDSERRFKRMEHMFL